MNLNQLNNKKEVNVVKDKNNKRKPEDNEDVHDDEDDNDDDSFWMDNSWSQLTPSSKKQRTKESNILSTSNYASPEPHELSYERSHVALVED